MYKRLLALLVFVPMFLLAWYVRSPRQPPNGPVSSATADRPRSDGKYGRARSGEEAGEPRDGEEYNRAGRRSRGRGAREEGRRGQPGEFDFFLLNLSWSPEFCATHPGKPECAAAPGFVLHGLWPQNNDGSYPEHCSDAPGPADVSAFKDIFPDAGLLEHEWTTHGTCSGERAEVYFEQARAAMRGVKIPASLDQGGGPSAITPEAILASFARNNPAIPRESFALSCGNNYLTAVEVCLDRSLHAVACSNVRSCRANSVRIVPRGAGR